MVAIGQRGNFVLRKKIYNHGLSLPQTIMHLGTFRHDISYWKEDQTLKEIFKRYVNKQL